jgi:hypothetical protein
VPSKYATETIIKAFDEFILSTGGNVDHRAAGNRDRKALMDFLKKLHHLPLTDTITIMYKIMKEGWTTHNVDGSPGMPQIDLSKNPCPESWWVYDEHGRCNGKESG